MADETTPQSRSIVTLAEAKSAGAKRYFTGTPCKRGHFADRVTIDRSCTDCNYLKDAAYKARNRSELADKRKTPEHREYFRAYYAANRDKMHGIAARWRERHREVARERTRAYVAAYPERQKASEAKYRSRNRAKINAVNTAYRNANPEKGRMQRTKWAAQNLDKLCAKASARRAVKLQATPLWATMEELLCFYSEAMRVSRETGVEHHVDHIVPLQSKLVCGLHCPANLQVIIGRDNISKGNRRWPDMWS